MVDTVENPEQSKQKRNITANTTLTVEEYNQLKALLKIQNGNNQPLANATGTPTCNVTHHDPHSTLYWIVDSGATDHVSHLSPTHNTLKGSHGYVGLPNGGKAYIESIGTFNLSQEFSLDGVLHVPNFRVNLISVSKLTRALRCIVIFYPDFCVVQDMNTRRTIGLGKHYNGLYYLTATQNPRLANHITSTSDLWHQ